ncbi:hypothetical protein BpHYR1_003276 [Brachionus plicatilis]|uniref:Uncharacterized protein n=1 Tax=Brachionus plicatilis TaxID=10195 RepID=A0A3M7QCQ5_BRAPC|nr:hypothetical protein BpHYR1_003276 [Brachionus plicatilis]
MKISVEKSCSVVFSRYKKESDNLNLKIYGNRIMSQKKSKGFELRYIEYPTPLCNCYLRALARISMLGICK